MRQVRAPLVSVIIPAFNASRHILGAIASALDQDYPDLEIIVADDGSADGTPELVEAKYGNEVRLIRLRRNSGGPAAPRNAAVRASRGALLAFLDADDVWLAGKLSRQVPLFDDPAVGLAYGRVEWIDSGGRRLGRSLGGPARGRCFPRLLAQDRGTIIYPSAVVVTREAFERAGGFDEGLLLSEGFYFCLKVAAGSSLAFLNEPVALYRVHAASHSARDRLALDEHISVYRSLDARIPRWRVLAPRFSREEMLANLLFLAAKEAWEKGDEPRARRSLSQAARRLGLPRGAREAFVVAAELFLGSK